MRPLKSQLISLCKDRNIEYSVFESKDKKMDIRWSIKMKFPTNMVVSVHLSWKNQYTAYLDDFNTSRNISWLIHFDIYGFVCWLNEYGLMS